jgi:hypothetical protein
MAASRRPLIHVKAGHAPESHTARVEISHCHAADRNAIRLPAAVARLEAARQAGAA